LTIQGYDDGAPIFMVEATLNTAGPQWVAGNLASVDQLTFSTTEKWQFAMDNFTFNETSAVPLPPSVWLLGSGLIGLVGLRRKFTNYLKR